MKVLLVPWALLLFGVSLNSGHYIRDTEDGNSVYKVKDDSSGVTFVNPKPDKPTLREILYYHIIERPRDTEAEQPAVTERYFTNSHGNPFLDLATLLEGEAYDENQEEHDDGSYVEQNDQHEELDDQGAENHEEEPELTTTQKTLTDEDVKEAYKSRNYLFDQMRQRYSVKRMAVPDSLSRRKRQAELESLPAPPGLSTDTASQDAYMQPRTYGMNLDSDGGYVWNNLNKPPTYYELGPSNGGPDEGSYGSSQGQENQPPSSENAYIPPTSEPNDSGSSEDIYINTYNPNTQPLDTGAANPPVNESPEEINENPGPANGTPEVINENPGPVNESPEAINETPEANLENDSSASYPVEPITGDNSNAQSDSDFANPIGPEVYENPETIPVDNPEPSAPQIESEEPHAEYPSEGSVGESNENTGYGYGQPEESKPEATHEENSEGDQIKEMPDAPTLPPLNYDNLPDYIRDTISSTEKPASYEQTENPYTNPQPNSEDKQVMDEQMEGAIATMPPVEDIPKTYGMNLTENGGHVWNDMVNPPVSYDVGSPSQPEKENKEEQPPATAQPEEPENPIPEPVLPETEEPANPEETNQEPEINESEENKPIEEPSEEPANPEEEKPEPSIPDTDDNKPVEESAEISETVEPENPELVPELGNEETEQPHEEPGEGKPVEDQKPDIMSELLKSEQFWNWLGKWTATYTELLEKHIRKIAIQEICNRQKSGEQMCLLEDQPEDTGLVIKDGKIIVDGKEIDMTHTDNLDQNLKRGHQNNKGDNDKKNKNENKIEASTIYGNSVGNEKVTNVFIFTADKADEVIDKLKPANESAVDFVIDDRIKENEENKDKSIEDAKEVEESLVDTTDKEKPAKEEIKKEESNTSEANEEGLTKEEASKEEPTEVETTHEEVNNEDTEGSNESDDKEELNNEEATKEPKPEADKNESSSQSGDIGESEDKKEDIEESKLEPSESDSDLI